MLPQQSSPIYNLTIPSTGKSVKYRPFLVKEQKALLVAHASEDTTVMLDTLKSIIRDCIKEDVNVNKLATFDIEYIFSQIRAKSVGEVVELKFKCAHCEKEENEVVVPVDITTIEVHRVEGHSNTIHLFDDVGIVLNYPNVDILNKFKDSSEDIDTVFELIIECTEHIYNTEEVFSKKEQSHEDMMQFLGNLTTDQFSKIKFFFESMPTLKKDIEFTCPACGAHNESRIEGISSFF